MSHLGDQKQPGGHIHYKGGQEEPGWLVFYTSLELTEHPHELTDIRMLRQVKVCQTRNSLRDPPAPCKLHIYLPLSLLPVQLSVLDHRTRTIQKALRMDTRATSVTPRSPRSLLTAAVCRELRSLDALADKLDTVTVHTNKPVMTHIPPSPPTGMFMGGSLSRGMTRSVREKISRQPAPVKGWVFSIRIVSGMLFFPCCSPCLQGQQIT